MKYTVRIYPMKKKMANGNIKNYVVNVLEKN